MPLTADDIKQLQDQANAVGAIAEKYGGGAGADAAKVAKNAGGGALTGLSVGAALGTAFPVIGNVIGAAVGAIIGALAAAAATLAEIFGKNPHADEQKAFHAAATALFQKVQPAVDSIPDVGARNWVISAISKHMQRNPVDTNWYTVQIHLSNYPNMVTPDGYACHGGKFPADAACTAIFFDGRNIGAAAEGLDQAIQAALLEYAKAHAPPPAFLTRRRVGFGAAILAVVGLGGAAVYYKGKKR